MTDGEDWRQRGTGQGYPQGQPWEAQQYDPTAHAQRLGGAPPQREPWQQYPPQQPPQGFQQPQYPPQDYGQQPYPGQPPWQGQQPPQGPRRRKRRLGRKIAGGIAGLVVVIIGIAVANSGGGHTVDTTGTTGAATATGGNTAAHAAPKTAGIGSAITLAGNDNGEKMGVTVTKVIATAQPADDFSSPPAGDRLYAVQFRLTDTGSTAYSDAPDNSAVIVDTAGQSYQSALDNAADCQSFAGTENIAPRSSGLGCVVFEVPEAAKIASVQFTLDSGFGPQTGQWNAR